MNNNPDKKKKATTEGIEVQGQAKPQVKQVQPSNEEQMARRQSAPRPTIQGEAQKILQQAQQAQMIQGGMGGGAINGFKALSQVI